MYIVRQQLRGQIKLETDLGEIWKGDIRIVPFWSTYVFGEALKISSDSGRKFYLNVPDNLSGDGPSIIH